MIKEVRDFYGISQNSLAGYLGVTRSQLSMAEIGHRELNASQTLLLSKLYKATNSKNLTNKSTEIEIIKKNQKFNLEKNILTKKQDNQFQLALTKRSLNKLRENQLRAIKILSSLEILRENADPMDKSLIQMIKNGAEKLYKKNGEDSQFLLELKLHGIIAQSAFLKK